MEIWRVLQFVTAFILSLSTLCHSLDDSPDVQEDAGITNSINSPSHVSETEQFTNDAVDASIQKDTVEDLESFTTEAKAEAEKDENQDEQTSTILTETEEEKNIKQENDVPLTDKTHTDSSSNIQHSPKPKQQQKIVLQAFGSFDSDSEEGVSDTDSSEKEDKLWTDETEEETDQTRSGGRRFFSLMNLIKFLLNPVIEEFEEVEKSSSTKDAASSSVTTSTEASNQSDLTSVATGNSSEVEDKEEKKNGTDAGKKTKFQCVGRNVTENTTAIVRIVNSTLLLERLSFDKNHSTADCVLVMFYAPWCHFCANTAPHYNALARAFPQLEVLAVDTVHFSNLNARFGTVAVPNIMLFHQSRSAVRFNHTERDFYTFLQFITNTTGLEANGSVELSQEDYEGPLSSVPTEETDYLLWFAWIFITVCSGHIFISSQMGQRAIERVMVLWQEHQHQHIE